MREKNFEIGSVVLEITPNIQIQNFTSINIISKSIDKCILFVIFIY